MTACITGWAHSRFGKLEGETVESLIVGVATRALEHAGIAASDVDEIVLGHFNAGFCEQDFTASLVLQASDGFRFTRATRVENACATGSAAVACLGPGARMLVFGSMSGEPLRFSPRALMTPGASMAGFWLSNWILAQGLVTRLRLVKCIANLIREGVLASEVGQSFPLDQITDAVRESNKVARAGKVLLRISAE